MKRHPREEPCVQAENELRAFILDLEEKYKLTTGELLRVVMGACGGFISNMARYMIRDERHPNNPNKSGGIA